MEVYLAKSAGFCFGVKRAVDCVYEKIDKQENAHEHNKIYTFGPIIHNKNVISDLSSRGVKVINELNVNDGEVIIRSHGVSKTIYDELDAKEIKYTDCTCPFVKKIHNIVHSNFYEKNRAIIIIGNPDHPEIVGINGWCDNSAVVVNSVDAAEETDFDNNKKYSIVVQTTFQHNIFNAIIEVLKSKISDIEIFNTICNATNERQNEAIELAKKMDKMVVLGDTESSNTKKLYEISKKYNKNTYLCEAIQDLRLNIFSKNDKIGITAGASTPSAIIKEALNKMSELENQTFEEMLNENMVTLHSNDVVKGTVIKVTNDEVSVNLGYKSDGIITRAEFSDDPNVNLENAVKAGDSIDVLVLRVNDGDGNVLLSKRRLDAVKGYEEIEAAFNDKTVVMGKVVDVVKGGLIILINGIRAFVPSSQVSNRYVENLQDYKGKTLDFNIIEFDRSKQRIVAGRKAIAQVAYDKKRKEVFEKLSAGDRIEGTVSRIVDFGAFVDLGGVDGLIHISEMSWGRVKRVSDVLSEGDNVVVTVLDVNAEKGKISLSLKDINNDPWNKANDKYPIGSIVEGKVVRIVPFGAFVELEEGLDGLVHISQISYKHVVKPEDVLSIGEIIQAKITDLDIENRKISLSIKEAAGVPEEDSSENTNADEEHKETAQVNETEENSEEQSAE